MLPHLRRIEDPGTAGASPELCRRPPRAPVPRRPDRSASRSCGASDGSRSRRRGSDTLRHNVKRSFNHIVTATDRTITPIRPNGSFF